VALLEKERFPRRKVCGECVSANNLALLDALGIGTEFTAQAGAELREVALFSGACSIRAPLPAAQDSRRAWGRALGRERLDLLLAERARASGAHLWQPCHAQRLEAIPGAMQCQVRVSRRALATLTAPIVIDAHGSWQRDLVIAERQRSRRRCGEWLAFKANYSAARLPQGLLPVLAFSGGYGGMVIAEADRATLACCIRARTLAACRRSLPGIPAGLAVEAYLRRSCAGVEASLAGARQEGSWLAAGPLRPGMHQALRARRALAEGYFAVGNAAAEAHPIIGEGISMALQSAWLLAHLLLEADTVQLAGPRGREARLWLQQRYRRAWRDAFRARLRWAALFAHLAMQPAAMACLLPLLRTQPQLLTHAARWSGKTRGPLPLQEPR
jgi:2-polyprenyl-6-methoxyphenol hydroxylase-like FAD-dependent oxidoreductase